jgi:class 3 adenylate cyclase
VLVTRSAQAALEPGDLKLRALGPQRLRGLGEPIELYQAMLPDLRESFPPLRVGD